MRILTIIPTMGIGGAEAVAEMLVRGARDAGHETVLAGGGGFRAEALQADGVQHLALPLASRRPRDLLAAIRTLRATEAPDLVHAHNVKAALVARLGLGRGVPVLATVHGVPDAAWPTAARILRRTADLVIAVSPHVADQLVSHGVPVSRVITIENAVAPLPRHDRAEARRQLDLDPDAPVVLCLARLAEQKRHDLLVEAWADLVPQLADSDDRAAVLVIAGDGPTRAAVTEAVERRCAPGSVRMLGARDDAALLLAAADVLVLPTDWEGLPISLLEAMGLGVPVVVSRVGGVIETLGDAVRLVEPGDARDLREALHELLTDPDRRTRLGARGAALVAERFDPDHLLHQHDDTYHRLVTGGRREIHP